MLSLPGIRVGRAGHGEIPRAAAARPRRRGAARGQRGRPGDPRARSPGRHAGPATSRLTIDADLQQSVLGASRRRERQRRGAGRAQRRGAGDGHQPVVRSQRCSTPASRRRSGSQWTSNRRAPLINKAAAGLYAPGSTFKIVVAMAGLESKAITPGDRINCPGYLDLGDTPLPLLEQRRPRHARPARRHQEQLRRVLLRGGAAHRHRPHRRDGQPLRARRSARDRAARRAQRPRADARMAHRAGQGVEHRRHDRRRHRPGLPAGHAAVAGGDGGAHRHRARGAAAPHPRDRRRAAAGRSAADVARARPARARDCTRCARACGRW